MHAKQLVRFVRVAVVPVAVRHVVITSLEGEFVIVDILICESGELDTT